MYAGCWLAANVFIRRQLIVGDFSFPIILRLANGKSMNIFECHPTTYTWIESTHMQFFNTGFSGSFAFAVENLCLLTNDTTSRLWAVRGKVRILHRTSCFRGGKFIADFRDVSKSFCTTLHWIGCKLSGNAEIEHNLLGPGEWWSFLSIDSGGVVTWRNRGHVKELFVVIMWRNNLIRS